MAVQAHFGSQTESRSPLIVLFDVVLKVLFVGLRRVDAAERAVVGIAHAHALVCVVFIVGRQNESSAHYACHGCHEAPWCAHAGVPRCLLRCGEGIVVLVAFKPVVGTVKPVVDPGVCGVGEVIPCGGMYGQSEAQLLDWLEYQTEFHIESGA